MTIINNTHKFIFIHIPKNAGTTVNTVLSTFTSWSDIELGGTAYGETLAPIYLKRFGVGKHSRPGQLRKLVGENVWKTYFKFTFVRDPYARTFSIYRFLKKWRNWKGSEVMDEFTTFEKFVTSDLFQNHSGPNFMFLPQHNWVENKKEVPLLNFTGKVEHIGEDLQTVADKVGIKLESSGLPVKNDSGEPAEFRAAYSEKALNIVARRYERDFLLFDYPQNPLASRRKVAAG